MENNLAEKTYVPGSSSRRARKSLLEQKFSTSPQKKEKQFQISKPKKENLQKDLLSKQTQERHMPTCLWQQKKKNNISSKERKDFMDDSKGNQTRKPW